MKLRYYLRGLGIGIVVTALVMGLSNQDARPLTDAEIKAKAATLGMVESDSLKLSDVSQMPDAETTAEPSQEPAEASTAEPSQEPTEVPTAEPSQKPTEAPTAEPSQEPTAEPMQKPIVSGELATITVKPGSGSDTVSRQLEQAGLVESATDFDNYLIDNGYSRRISVGTYEIPLGTSEEEIAKIITKSR